MSLDHYMDDFGRDLSRAAVTRRRRRLRTRLALALPAAAAAVAAAVMLPNGDGSVDALAAAREALAPSGEIVHMTIQTKQTNGSQWPAIEQWYAADPVRWRTRSELPDGRRVVPRMTDRHGRITGRMETAFSDDRLRLYFAQRDVVTIYRGMRPQPGLAAPGIAGGDPASELREQLNAGDVRDDGIVTVDGRRVRRLVSDRDHGVRFVYYMDPDTFAPVGGRLSFESRGGIKMGGQEFTVTGYERIPLTAETAKLLQIEKTPNTKFVWKDVKK